MRLILCRGVDLSLNRFGIGLTEANYRIGLQKPITESLAWGRDSWRRPF